VIHIIAVIYVIDAIALIDMALIDMSLLNMSLIDMSYSLCNKTCHSYVLDTMYVIGLCAT